MVVAISLSERQTQNAVQDNIDTNRIVQTHRNELVKQGGHENEKK